MTMRQASTWAVVASALGAVACGEWVGIAPTGNGGDGGACYMAEPLGKPFVTDPYCACGTHETACVGPAGSPGFCDPESERCCVGLDPDCCAGCLVTEYVCGRNIDVCLPKCPTGQTCGAHDGRCHDDSM